MKTNHGFNLINKEYNTDIESEVYQFEHEKTGAKLVFIENDDTNKVFSIGFKTPSNNSTGVAHILEHSTLCGSDKYPVKEPFVELLKSSLNTFLNAMTYPDKTVYPVASTNDKDFRNLMDVYLDAVFYPNIYKNENTFKQEGWHYHLEDKENPLIYNGVVYNEMKGVYSDPDSLMERYSAQELYPDTIYGQESGGDPNEIPELTYENFLDFHKRLYHPSNSYIYLYGNNNLDEQLEYLDSWLSKFEKEEIDSTIPLQEPLKERVEKTFSYPISPEADLENKDMISLYYVLKPDLTASEQRALKILIDLLFGYNSSILKKRILDKGIAGDVTAYFETPLQQPLIAIHLKDTNEKNKEAFIQTVEDTLKELVNEGIDSELLEATINSNEFKTLEQLGGENAMTPKGLLVGLQLFDNWLYDKDIFEKLDVSSQFETLEDFKKNKGFEKLLEDHLINNPHQALITLVPDKELAAKNEKALTEKLQEYKDSLSEEELDAIVESTKDLIAEQSKMDSPEDLAKIPRLSVSEIKKEIEPITWEELKIDDVPVLYVNSGSKDIIYLDCSFDIHSLEAEELSYLAILEYILASISTKNRNYEQLNKEMSTYTGGISTHVSISKHLETKNTLSHFKVSLPTRAQYLDQAMDLFKDILTESIFSEKDVIRDLVKEARLAKQSEIQNQGNSIAAIRMLSNVSEQHKLLDILDGIDYYNFVADLDENFDDRWDELQKNLEKVYDKIINQHKLVISFTCQESYKDQVLQKLKELLSSIKNEEFEAKNFNFEQINNQEGFITPGNVMYNAKGGVVDLSDANIGALRVLKTILSMDYLWNKIRVLGGAYGSGFSFGRAGEIYFNSFRDPNLEKTYENFDQVVDYIDALDLTQDEIDKYIIGTIGSLDFPLSTKSKFRLATTMYLNGLTNELRQKERDQVLSVDLDELKKTAKYLKDVLEQDNICTIGTETAINGSKEKFKEIEYIH